MVNVRYPGKILVNMNYQEFSKFFLKRVVVVIERLVGVFLYLFPPFILQAIYIL